MKVNTFSKFGICVGAIALVVGTFAAPAQADPADATFGQLVGLGSDTTQDVVDGLAAAITPLASSSTPAGSLASYLATGSTTVVTRSGAAAIPRASGSGSGRDMLRVAIGQTTSATIAASNGSGSSANVTANKDNSVGMIDFARSSSAASSLLDGGVLTYIPFARDAVTIAVDPDSPLAVVPFVLGASTVTGAPSLYNIYRGDVRYAYISGSAGSYVYNSAGATAEAAPVGTTAYAIQAYLPKVGSGTRSYFIGKIGISEANIVTINGATPNTIKSTYGASIAVEEHDGSVVDGDNTAIVPFSIAQWVAQTNEKAPDRRHDAILTQMDAIAPTTGSGTAYATNPLYTAMVRDVFNIVPSRLADDESSAINDMFVGTSSKVCSATSTIIEYGFALMPGTTAATTCGYTGYDTYAGSSSSVELAIADASIAGTETFSATVNVTSTHDQGGTVYIVNSADVELGSYLIPAGQTSATFTFAPNATGEATVHAEFVPTLAGIAGSSSATVNVTVTAAAANVALSTKATTKVGATTNVIVYAHDGSPLGGTLVLKNGGTTLGTVVLEAGERAALFSFKPTSASSLALNATYTAPVGALVGNGATVGSKTVTVGKGTAAITVAPVASVRKAVAAKVVVTLTGIAGVKPGGTVTIKEGSTTRGTGTLVATSGSTAATSKVTVTLSKFTTTGSKTLTVYYNGSALWNTANKTSIKVTVTP
jgi:hypothetical protein